MPFIELDQNYGEDTKFIVLDLNLVGCEVSMQVEAYMQVARELDNGKVESGIKDHAVQTKEVDIDEEMKHIKDYYGDEVDYSETEDVGGWCDKTD